VATVLIQKFRGMAMAAGHRIGMNGGHKSTEGAELMGNYIGAEKTKGERLDSIIA
jgi:hypothetical protein